MDPLSLEDVKQRLPGMPLADATRFAAEHCLTLRVIRVGDQHCIVTRDYRPDRINVAVDKDKQRVVEVTGIG